MSASRSGPGSAAPPPGRAAPSWPLAPAVAVLAFPVAADAHGFGQRYELPLPLSLYLFGAAAAVALSFVVFGLFVRRRATPQRHGGIDLLATRAGRAIAHPALAWGLRLAALALFAVTVAAGLIGDQNPYRNIAPTLVWIVWWVGLVYVAAFLGDLWALINPWRTLFDGADRLWRQLVPGGALSLGVPYPRPLGVWPACALLLAFSWVELVYPYAASPAHIASLAIAYTILTCAGMIAFGRDVWLRHGEVFSLVFGTFARFAPTEAKDGRLLLRPFGRGLIEGEPVPASMVAFMLLLLATVLYDGLIGTGEWELLEGALQDMLANPGGQASIVIRSFGLIAVWLVFLAAFLGISAAMSALAGGDPGPLAVARTFAPTLIPIAIGYHVAHYLVFLLVQGQYIIPLLSDPFGYGWDLLGTAGYRVDIAIVGARFAWYAAVAAIVAGHVTAVYLAHVKALAAFDTPRAALGTQAPLTALMVVYTFIGLSITAQPITESRTAAEPSALATGMVAIPAEAVLPDAEGRLRTVGPDRTARVKLTYKVLGSAFHDATRTSAADLLYAYAFAYRWSDEGGGAGAHYDPFIDAATAPLRRHLVAVRVGATDTASRSFRVGDVEFVREVFTVEVYLSIAPGDVEWNALVAPPWSTLPWHLLVLMEEAVSRGWAAFSEDEARRRGVAWLDLVRSSELGAKLAALVAEFERGAYRPEALRAHVGEQEARRRWRALAAFHERTSHFLVTNGPYRLKSWTPRSVTLEAFRDLTYPLGVGSYDSYAVPRRGFITKLDWTPARLDVSGDIELVEKFQRSYRLVRTPLKAVPPAALKRAAPEFRYVVTDEAGRVAAAGVALPAEDARFQVDLKGRLPPGRYTLRALIAVNGNVMNAELHRMPLVVP